GALAAIAEQWRAHVERWLSITEPLVHDGAPDDVERYFLFQTLVGAWPISADRLTAYMRKAMREAKRTTNWISPDTEREDAVARFCEELVDHAQFMSSFTPFAEEVALAGERAALGQLVL